MNQKVHNKTTSFLVTLIIVLTLLLATPYNALAQEQTFPDVATNSIFYRPIEYFANLGVVEGYKDEASGLSYFKPDRLVNRAEAMKIILAGSTKKYVLDENIAEDVFGDVKKDQWFAPFIKKAKEQGIVKGDDTTGLFDPARTVNKVELLKMVMLANDIDVEAETKGMTEAPAPDVPKDAWFSSYIQYGKDYGIIFPDTYGRLHPGKSLSRGEVMEIMYNTVKVLKGGDTQVYLAKTEAKIFSAITNINNQDYVQAIIDIEKANEFSGTALKLSPNEVIVQEAHAITNGFAIALTGFKAWKEDGSIDLAKKKGTEAETAIKSVTQLVDLKNSLLTLIGALKTAQ